MKVIFRISAWLNLILLGLLGVSWIKLHGLAPEASSRTMPSTPTPVAAPPARAVPEATRVEPGPFRWSQLDASDYHVYVKNLRATGCPEPSVRAIVTADVAAVYEQRRRRLEQTLADLDGGSEASRLGAINEEQAIQAELREIPGEKTATIEDLLGLAPSRVATAAAGTPVALPLALQTFDVATLKLDAGQIEAMKELRQHFLEQMGGAPPNPKDAAAVERWQNAQAEADDQMAGFLGSEAYQNMQLQALANSQAEKSGGH